MNKRVCSVCGSDRVEVSLPAWFNPTTWDHIDTDWDADVMYTWCRECDESRKGDWTEEAA